MVFAATYMANIYLTLHRNELISYSYLIIVVGHNIFVFHLYSLVRTDYALCIMANIFTLLDYIAGNTIIRFTNTDPALLKVDAVVEEQDTNLMLGKAPVIMDTIESFPALVRKMEQQMLEVPGNVIVKKSLPRRFIAIVYDIEQTPISRKSWMVKALQNILLQCDTHKIKVLAMPLLGTSYGNLKEEVVIKMLQDLLFNNRQHYLKKILIYKL